MTLTRRPATRTDLPAITELQRTWDTHWFGAPEHDESEVAEELELVDLDANSLLVLDDTGIVGMGWWWRTESGVIVHPDAGPDVRGAVLDWFGAGESPSMTLLERDERTRADVESRGWRHSHSSFELLRPVTTDWALAAPEWPDGIDAADMRHEDAAAVHTLIYEDAQWASVRGHVDRDFEEWRSIFLTDTDAARGQLVARRGDALVGVAHGRIFSDGTGWIAQLAVSADERGRGLGRALLLEALRRHVAGGASVLGLGVQATNRGALRLYLDVGLRVEREWQTFARESD